MESYHQFDLILMNKMETLSPIKCPTEDLISGEKFAEDFLFNDNFDGIELLADLDQDEKSYLEELQQITDQIDLPLYDLLVTGNTQSPVNLNEKDVSPIEILDFESICESNVTSSYSPTTSENLSGIQDDVFMENIPINNANNFDHDYPMDSSTQSSGQSSPHEFFNEHSNSTTYNMSYNNESFTINEEVQQPNNFFNNETTKDNIQFFGAFNSDANDSISQDFDNFSDADDKTSSSCSYISDEPAKKSSKLRGVTKKRSARNPEEKKSRKKEQNKNAATRYRKKKKEEIHVIVGEERQLMDRNRKLVTTYKDTKREVKYLKSLLRELFEIRGFALNINQNY